MWRTIRFTHYPAMQLLWLAEEDYLVLFLDMGLLLRTCSQLSKEGKLAVPFINFNQLHLQRAKPNLTTLSGPNQTRWILAGPPFRQQLHKLNPVDFSHSLKVKPISLLPLIGQSQILHVHILEVCSWRTFFSSPIILLLHLRVLQFLCWRNQNQVLACSFD